MKVDVSAGVSADKSVHVDINVDGRHAVVTFADGEITLEVPADEGDLTLVVPEAIAAVDPAG
jgi:hypothetical protein